ncbi:hypothetical protein [uncultured Treponema sp.]|uniref:hypothetical protein n=1 Tax=uncultured Treponema sp. TaxID=162155 RepID=UPI0015C0A054|nr:hypothetical protein [uncultured Treponema sp.]
MEESIFSGSILSFKKQGRAKTYPPPKKKIISAGAIANGKSLSKLDFSIRFVRPKEQNPG